MIKILFTFFYMLSFSAPVFAEEELVAPPSIFVPSDTTDFSLDLDLLLSQEFMPTTQTSTTVVDAVIEEKVVNRVLLPEKNFQTFIKIVNKRSNQNKKITLQAEVPYVYDEELKVLSYYCIENYANVYQNDVAFIDVESKEGDVLFSGWIYRKFPSVSGLEDAVYALSLTGCKNSDKLKMPNLSVISEEN